MSVKSYQYTFASGETKQYRGGEYFTIEQLVDEVSVEIFSPRGTSLGKVENVGAGFWIKLVAENGIVGRVDVYSATAQTINVIVGSGEFGVNKTSTNITGGTLDPITMSSFWAIYLQSTLETIVAPAANVNGVQIDNIILSAWGATGNARVMHKSSAPVADTDGYGLCGGYTNTPPDKVDTPIIIPAGQGLYAQGSVNNICYATVAYKIL